MVEVAEDHQGEPCPAGAGEVDRSGEGNRVSVQILTPPRLEPSPYRDRLENLARRRHLDMVWIVVGNRTFTKLQLCLVDHLGKDIRTVAFTKATQHADLGDLAESICDWIMDPRADVVH